MPTYPIQFRRDTPENWQAANPVLREGEMGIELPGTVGENGVEAFKYKIGDGVRAWNDLPYASGPAGPSPEYEWNGTSIRFKNPDGTWGDYIDIQGPQGAQGEQGEPGPAGEAVPATTTTIGGVIVGDGLEVTEEGCISVTLPVATDKTPGIMRPDGETCVVVDGVLSSRAAPYNSRVVITESNAAWQSPVTGWARILLIGGGGGGCGGGGDQYTACSGGSGGGGERKVVYVYLTEGSTYACTIGAGGAGGVSNKTGNPIPVDATLGKAGGATKFVAGSVTHSAAGGGGGGTKTSFGFAAAGTPGGGGVTQGIGGIRGVLNTGGGGSYVTQFQSGQVIYGWGIGGLGGQGANPVVGHAIANGVVGVQGAIIIDYYDPKKETA